MSYPDYFEMKDSVKNPFYEALKAITQETPPKYCKGIFSSSELKEDAQNKLHQWCVNNSKPYWSTGIAILEAADNIVNEAVGNANIRSKKEL